MSYINNIIASVPTMSPKERKEWAAKAENMLKKSPEHSDARRLIDALAAAETRRPPDNQLEITGVLAWEKHQHGETTLRAFYGDKVVGKIFKKANHSSKDKDVYSVEILGQNVADAIHHIKDAREKGEEVFRALSAKLKP